MKLQHGVFTISLDFELYWGVRDKKTIAQYEQNLRGVRQAVPEMLRVFSDHDLHATWATVGFLFLANADDLRAHLPASRPAYRVGALNPYIYIDQAGELEPMFHFAPDLIRMICDQSGQELGTHTFSHYYCLAAGQSVDEFRADLAAAVAVAARDGRTLRSLVFPRNQWNAEYLAVLSELGLVCYRGNEPCWAYAAIEQDTAGCLTRAARLVDAYVNLFGHHTFDLAACSERTPYNFPSSRFLRPYSPRLAALEGWRLKRILDAMTYAATHRQIFHLWWHPHNFGAHTRENVAFLERIAAHYRQLAAQVGMTSLNMGELAALAGASDG